MRNSWIINENNNHFNKGTIIESSWDDDQFFINNKLVTNEQDEFLRYECKSLQKINNESNNNNSSD